jgi:hypothetical protein
MLKKVDGAGQRPAEMGYKSGDLYQRSQIFLKQINKLDPSIFRDQYLDSASTDLFFANKILGYNTSNLNGTLTFVAIHSRVFQNKY